MFKAARDHILCFNHRWSSKHVSMLTLLPFRRGNISNLLFGESIGQFQRMKVELHRETTQPSPPEIWRQFTLSFYTHLWLVSAEFRGKRCARRLSSLSPAFDEDSFGPRIWVSDLSRRWPVQWNCYSKCRAIDQIAKITEWCDSLSGWKVFAATSWRRRALTTPTEDADISQDHNAVVHERPLLCLSHKDYPRRGRKMRWCSVWAWVVGSG